MSKVEPVQVASAYRALGGSDFCGDQVGHWIRGAVATLCVVDGLGHGPAAEQAAKVILSFVSQNLDRSLQALFAGADEAARETRGAAVGLALVNLREMSLTHAGVGNTRAQLLQQTGRALSALSSSNGIVGAGYKKLCPETVSFAPGDLLLLYTDGFPSHVDVARFAWSRRAPEEVAREFLQKSALGTDDAAVLVARMESYG